MKLFRFFCFLTVFLFFVGHLFAHPHVFIQAKLQVIFDSDGLNGIRVFWAMDDMISTGLMFDYDKNFNSQFESNEVEQLKNEIFTPLKDVDYFTFISVGDHSCKLENYQSFKAAIEDFKVQYSYFVPCQVKADSSPRHLIISLYDPSFYNYIEVEKENIEMHKTEPFYLKVMSYKNPNISFYKKQFTPKQFDIEFAKK